MAFGNSRLRIARNPITAPAIEKASDSNIQVPGSGTVAYTWAAPVTEAWDQFGRLVEKASFCPGTTGTLFCQMKKLFELEAMFWASNTKK